MAEIWILRGKHKFFLLDFLNGMICKNRSEVMLANIFIKILLRIFKIWVECLFKEKIDFIKKILLDNGYPEDIVLNHISKKIAQFSTAKPFGPEKCPVYLRAPWIGSVSQQLEHQVKSAVQNCYGAVSPRWIFSSQCMLPAAKKDVLAANQRSVLFRNTCATVIVGT